LVKQREQQETSKRRAAVPPGIIQGRN